jgi:hypothetical protein
MPKSLIAQGFIIPLIIFVPLFLYFHSEYPGDLFTHLQYALVMYLAFVGWFLFSGAVGHKRHRSALTGRRLSHLKEHGFAIENIDNYWGYEGVYKDYFLRIYYDWNTSLSGRQFREVCVIVYFTPQVDEDGALDESFLNSLNKKYKDELWISFYSVNFGAFYLALHSRFNLATTFDDIKTRIDKSIIIATKENLKPLSKFEVEKLIDRRAYSFAPTIETFVEAKEGIA